MKLETQQLPVIICTANCPQCGNPTDDYPMFESGPGGDFDTWLSVTTGELYRINVLSITYGAATAEQCLAPIIEHAGGRDNLQHIPNDLHCKICGEIFHARSGRIVREERRNAFIVTA